MGTWAEPKKRNPVSLRPTRRHKSRLLCPAKRTRTTKTATSPRRSGIATVKTISRCRFRAEFFLSLAPALSRARRDHRFKPPCKACACGFPRSAQGLHAAVLVDIYQGAANYGFVLLA